MTKQKKVSNSIEKIDISVDRNRENIPILKGLDDGNFNKLVKGFSGEKEQNKIILSGFLNSTNVTLSQLGNIKIDINHIKNYVRNKPDISKDLEKKIAKLYLKKLFDSCVEDDDLISELHNVFSIHSEKLENKLEKQKLKKLINDLDPSKVTFFLKAHNITLKDLEDNEDDKNENILKEIKAIIDSDKRNIDFKMIRVGIESLLSDWDEKINSITVSNDEIFDLLGKSINKYTNFQSQSLDSQQIIQDLLQFELKGIANNVKLWRENAEKDMEDLVLPVNDISQLFDEAKDSEILQLDLQKSGIEDILILNEHEIATKEKTYRKDYIHRLQQQGLSEDFIKKLKKLLLGKVEASTLKNNLKKWVEYTNKQIWRKYIENFEKIGKNPEFVAIIKKLYSSNFNFSKLEKKEQSLLWQNLIVDKFDKKENSFAKYSGLDQEDFKSFLKDLYDFEKDEATIDINGVGSLKLHITKELQGGENKAFLDVENFKNMDEIQPFEFIVNIDDNTPEFIQDLESDDTPLRADGIMETHMVKGGKLNIGNGYKLEICEKEITKSQLDELLFCKDLPELNEKLKELGLFEELKDEVYNTRKEIFQPQNVYTNLDEDGFDTGRGNNSSTISYSDKVNIFEEVLKKLDVKVIKRDLIFEGKNIDKLHQIYIMSKLWGKQEKQRQEINEKGIQQQDEKVSGLLDAAYESEELGDADSGKVKATGIWNDIKSGYQNEYKPNKGEDGYEDFDIESLEDGNTIYGNAKKYRESLDEEGKKAFREKLIELCENDSDIDKEDRKDVIGEIDNLIDYLEHPHSTTIPDDGEKKEIEPEKTAEEKFQEVWESLPGDKECKKMTKGMRLYFDLGESQLPPQDITDALKSFYCFEIIEVGDATFTLKAVGGDLPSGLVGNEYEIQKDQLESIKKGGSIYKVRGDDKRDWTSCMESINKAGFFKKFTAFGDMEGQVRLKGDKFVKNVIVNGKTEEVEVKYFDRVEGVFDDSKKEIKDRGQGEKIYKYEIKKVNTSKGTVTLASTFDGHDENYNDIKYKYENEIPFEQFILLMEGKRLKGYTEDQQKEMETKYSIDDPKRLPTKGMRKRISIGAVINVFKNTSKAIKSKIEERRKEQEEDLENYLFSQEGLDLYGKLGGLLGNSSMGDAVKKMQYEFYTNRENRTWKKIEEWYKIFESDPQYSEFFGDHLFAILDRQGYVGNDKDRYKFAAAFLVMVKKEGPYPRQFANQKDRGKRVENLLGPEHKIRFLNFYEKKKNEIQQAKDLGYPSGDRLEKQEELNKMEIQYIISTIDGRAPYGPCSNEYMLKSLWSKNFMSKLEENISGYYNNHETEKNKLETFYSAEESYLRNLGSGKFHAALPALERMCETAKTKGEVFRIKGYLLGAMLMGIIKNDTTAKVTKSFWATCRSMGFAPGYRMRDIEHQDKVKILLDGVTNGEFSKDPNLKINLSDFEPGNIKDGKYSFGKVFQSYRNSHGKAILKKVENPTYKNGNGDKSIVDLANEKDNPNNYVFKEIIKNSTTNEIDTKGNATPTFAQESPLTATSNMVKEYIPRNGKYSKLKSEEDVSNAEDFWTKANEVIPSAEVESDQETVDFVFKKFFNWFDDVLTTETQKMILRSLPLIKQEAKYAPNNARYMLWYMLKGNMHDKTHGAFPTEFNQVMDKFVDFFDKNIQKINRGTIKAAFDDDDVVKSFNNPYVLLGLKKFYTKYMNGWGKDKTRYKKNADLNLLKLNLSKPKRWDDTINDKIEELRKRTKEYDTPNISFDPDSPQTVPVGDLSDHDVNEEMSKLGETRY